MVSTNQKTQVDNRGIKFMIFTGILFILTNGITFGLHYKNMLDVLMYLFIAIQATTFLFFLVIMVSVNKASKKNFEITENGVKRLATPSEINFVKTQVLSTVSKEILKFLIKNALVIIIILYGIDYITGGEGSIGDLHPFAIFAGIIASMWLYNLIPLDIKTEVSKLSDNKIK